MKQQSMERAREVFRIESECIREMEALFDEKAVSLAVEYLKNAERIATSGCGHSGIACRHLAHLLCCVEQPAHFISPAEAVHGGTGYLRQGDAMVLASRGGATEELIPIAEICKKKGVRIIVITEKTDSVLAGYADVVIRQHVNRETDKYNAQGTTSTTALCVLAHVLVMALMEETDYRNEQFALIHPGGAVGKRLVKENMK